MSDKVNSPEHYAGKYPFEVIDLIENALELALAERQLDFTPFEAYCLGNELKYRMKAGFKGDPAEDIAKAMKYYEFRTGENSTHTCSECTCSTIGCSVCKHKAPADEAGDRRCADCVSFSLFEAE